MDSCWPGVPRGGVSVSQYILSDVDALVKCTDFRRFEIVTTRLASLRRRQIQRDTTSVFPIQGDDDYDYDSSE